MALTSAGPLTSGNIGETEASIRATRRRSVVATMIGNVLEWYDFVVFVYFAQIIGAKFFPSTDQVAALLSTLAVFAIGFVMRPVGGIIIGRFADRAGRKPALMLTIFLMAAGTMLIGILPDYAEIGILAPILITIARIVQGFSVGGEWGSAAVYLVEWAPANRRALFGSVHSLTTFGGVLLGSIVAAVLSTVMAPSLVDSWGWRIPFLLGGLIGVAGLYMRRSVEETAVFRTERVLPVEHGLNVWTLGLRIFALSCVVQLFNYVCFTYFPIFVQSYANLGRADALWANTAALAAAMVLCPLGGLISDRIGRRPMLIAGAVFSIFLTYPLVSWVLSSHGFSVVLAVQLCFALIYAFTGSCIQATFTELVPTSVRLIVISTAYSISGVVFGAFAPFASVWIIRETGAPISVAYLLIFSGIVAALGLIGLRETAGEPLP